MQSETQDPVMHTLTVKPDEKGKFKENFRTTATPIYKAFEPVSFDDREPMVTFEFFEADGTPWLPRADKVDKVQGNALNIFEQGRYEIIDLASTMHMNLWRKETSAPRRSTEQSDMKQYIADCREDRTRLDHIVVSFLSYPR